MNEYLPLNDHLLQIIIYPGPCTKMCHSPPQVGEMCNINDGYIEKIAEDLWLLD